MGNGEKRVNNSYKLMLLQLSSFYCWIIFQQQQQPYEKLQNTTTSTTAAATQKTTTATYLLRNVGKKWQYVESEYQKLYVTVFIDLESNVCV